MDENCEPSHDDSTPFEAIAFADSIPHVIGKCKNDLISPESNSQPLDETSLWPKKVEGPTHGMPNRCMIIPLDVLIKI